MARRSFKDSRRDVPSRSPFSGSGRRSLSWCAEAIIMYDQRSPVPVWDKLAGTTTLTAERSAVIKQTYLLFGLSVFSALVGGYIGATSETLARFFSGWMGWIAAILLLKHSSPNCNCGTPQPGAGHNGPRRGRVYIGHCHLAAVMGGSHRGTRTYPFRTSDHSLRIRRSYSVCDDYETHLFLPQEA